MNRKILLSALFWAATVGGIISLVTGDSQAVSLRIWLAGFAAWFAAATLLAFLRRVPLAPAPIRPMLRLRSKDAVPRTHRLRQLRFIESLLLRARDNRRAHSQQLRPRLALLADHYLPVVHGIDRQLQPERADELLGELIWLIADEESERTPTLVEIDAFVALVTSPVVPPNYSQEVA